MNRTAVVNVSLLALAAAGVFFLLRRRASQALVQDARGNVYNSAEVAAVFAEQDALFKPAPVKIANGINGPVYSTQ